MNYKRIDSMEYPLRPGEAWWVIHPNSSGGAFVIPTGATTVCLFDLESFEAGTVYRVDDKAAVEGWVQVSSSDLVLDMPQYVFARHFDAEIFVRGLAGKGATVPQDWRG